MADIRVVYQKPVLLSAKYGDGIFWRNGERWLRERGVEHRMLDLAPMMERDYLKRLQHDPHWRPEQRRAMEESRTEPERHTNGTERKVDERDLATETSSTD